MGSGKCSYPLAPPSPTSPCPTLEFKFVVRTINQDTKILPSVALFILKATFDGNGLKFHVECASQYKTAYPLWFGPLRSALVLCHPDTIKTVLSGHVPKEEFVYSLVMPFTGKTNLKI